jgi:threonine aldolase
MQVIELRSDTMTHPTAAMRRAMAAAEVGDDVFGEDPTVARLEQMAAECLGKEAALLVTSGTMGNLVCLLAHCGRGDEIILGNRSHTFFYEQGGAAALGGIHPRTIPNRADGKLDPGEIEAAIRTDNVHFPRTRLIVLENTHNLCGGYPLEAAYMRAVGELARRHGLKLHVDGARLFHAAVTLGEDVKDLVRDANSVSFCLSKGLASPVGSVVCGSRSFIQEARRARKVLGGGMRQAGVLAAAGIVSLTEMVERLAEDHAHARRLAEGLAEIPGIAVDPATIKTNIVYFDLEVPQSGAERLVALLQAEGVRMLPTGARRIRAVTHYHITADDIEKALAAVARVMRAL